MQAPPDFDLCDGLCTHNQHHMSLYSRWSTGIQGSRSYTSRCYGCQIYSIEIFMFKTHLSRCKHLLISIRETACARTIHITCHSTVDGVPKYSVPDRAQAVAMVTKHAQLTFLCSKHLCPITRFVTLSLKLSIYPNDKILSISGQH